MKKFGQIAGGIGLLFFVTSVVTLFVTSGSLVAFAVKLGLGVTGILVWAITNRGRLITWTRSLFFYSSSVVMGALVIALLFTANYLVAKKSRTWDLTAKKIHSLSPQTVETLKALKAPVKLLAFVPSDPPGARDALEGLFARYGQESARFTWEFLDPRRNPDLTAKYEIREGQPSTVLLQGEGPAQTHAIVNIARLVRAQDGEQELTQALLKLNTVGEQKVYFTTGHGEWPLAAAMGGPDGEAASLSELKNSLTQDGYAPAQLNLMTEEAVPKDASMVVIAGARGPFAESERVLLETYLEQGGRLVYFAEARAEPGLDALLLTYGVQVEKGIVADPKVNPKQPYLVISPFFADHPIVAPLKRAQGNVFFYSTRPLTRVGQGQLPGVDTTVVIVSSPYAWAETNADAEPTLDEGERSGQLGLVLAAERPVSQVEGRRFDQARLVVFGDSELLVNANWGNDFNRNLVLNALGWANGQATKITIRPPDRDISSLELTPDRLSAIRLVSMDLLPTLLIAVGLAIWLSRRSR